MPNHCTPNTQIYSVLPAGRMVSLSFDLLDFSLLSRSSCVFQYTLYIHRLRLPPFIKHTSSHLLLGACARLRWKYCITGYYWRKPTLIFIHRNNHPLCQLSIISLSIDASISARSLIYYTCSVHSSLYGSLLCT